MKYSDFPYKRIDINELRNDVKKMIDEFRSSKTANKQIKILQEYQILQYEFQTYASIAHLNFARNTKDKT